ncbi:hypothetical protein YC2023_018989 [Brassica napus]
MGSETDGLRHEAHDQTNSKPKAESYSTVKNTEALTTKTHAKGARCTTKPSRELLSMLSTSNDDTITKIVSEGSEECPKGQVPIHNPKTSVTNNFIYPQQFTKEGKIS